MSASLHASWQDRVYEVEQETSLVTEELLKAEQQIALAAGAVHKQAEAAKAELMQLEKALTDADAREFQTREGLRAAKEQKTQLAVDHQAVAAAYTALEGRVRALKALEGEVSTREDYEQVLATEATEWAVAEQRLRDERQRLDDELKEARAARKAELQALERDAQDAEDEVRTARMGRVMPTELVPLAALGSRQPSVAVAADAGAVVAPSCRLPSEAFGSKGQPRKRDCLGYVSSNSRS